MSDEYEGQSEESCRHEAARFRGVVLNGIRPRRIRLDLSASMNEEMSVNSKSANHFLVEIKLEDAILLKEELIHIIAQCRERGWRQVW